MSIDELSIRLQFTLHLLPLPLPRARPGGQLADEVVVEADYETKSTFVAEKRQIRQQLLHLTELAAVFLHRQIDWMCSRPIGI